MSINTASFDREVVEASKMLPVVVDFWAPWCGPCRALTPTLERIAAELAGRVKLVKINSDESPELSSAFGIRSIPHVFAFKDGRVVAQFTGAIPEQQVRAFFEKLLPSAAEEALQRAEQAFAAGALDEAEGWLEQVKGDLSLTSRITALRQGIVYARTGAEGPNEDELRGKITADPNDHEARLALASLYAAQRRYREAMDELLEIVRRARTWRDGEARTQLLSLLTLAADQPELVTEYRRKLASALY